MVLIDHKPESRSFHIFYQTHNLKGKRMKILTIQERLLWVSLGIQKNILWIALGLILAVVVIQNIHFRIPNPGFDAEAVEQAMGQ